MLGNMEVLDYLLSIHHLLDSAPSAVDLCAPVIRVTRVILATPHAHAVLPSIVAQVFLFLGDEGRDGLLVRLG